MPTEEIPAAQADLLHRMDEFFNTRRVEDLTRAAFHPDVDWPNVLEGTPLHGIDEVLAYWKRQFAVAHPLVRMEGMTAEPDGRIAARVRQGRRDANGDHWSDATVGHVYTFRGSKVAHREVRGRGARGRGHVQGENQGPHRGGSGVFRVVP